MGDIDLRFEKMTAVDERTIYAKLEAMKDIR